MTRRRPSGARKADPTYALGATFPTPFLPWGTLLAAFLICVIGPACRSDDTSPRADAPVVIASDGHPKDTPGPKPVPPSTLAVFLPQASDYEREVLSDGLLSFAEYNL